MLLVFISEDLYEFFSAIVVLPPVLLSQWSIS
jgi:hypothetical protein